MKHRVRLRISKTPINFAPQQHLRAEPFPPLTLGLLAFAGSKSFEPKGVASRAADVPAFAVLLDLNCSL
jgi:hypothetical protein